MADKLEIPTVLWGMYGVILHANEAFRELTGFEEELPNELGRFLLIEMFNIEALLFWRENIDKYYDSTMTIPIEVGFSFFWLSTTVITVEIYKK
jgi:PAS domain-containing protein